MSLTEPPPGLIRRPGSWLAGLALTALLLWMRLAPWPEWLTHLTIGKRAFVSAVLNGVTLAGLYVLVASGVTLIFGLMRYVDLGLGVGRASRGSTGRWWRSPG